MPNSVTVGLTTRRDDAADRTCRGDAETSSRPPQRRCGELGATDTRFAQLSGLVV